MSFLMNTHLRGLHFYRIIPEGGDKLTCDLDPFWDDGKCVRVRDSLLRVVSHIAVEDCEKVAQELKDGKKAFVIIPEGGKEYNYWCEEAGPKGVVMDVEIHVQ